MQNPYDVFFIRINDDLLLQRRMKRAHSTQHARDNKDYTDLAVNTAHTKRRSAAVHTKLQASVQLSLMYISCVIRSSNTQTKRILVPIFRYLRRPTYMRIIRTYTIRRSTYIRYYFADQHIV